MFDDKQRQDNVKKNESYFCRDMEQHSLSAEDLKHFDEHGYVVLRSVVSLEQCAFTVSEIEKAINIIGKSANDPSTWYTASTTPEPVTDRPTPPHN
jgi:hypothetical protein